MILALDANEKGESLTRKLLGMDIKDGEERPATLASASAIRLPDGFDDIGDMATVPDGKMRFMAALG